MVVVLLQNVFSGTILYAWSWTRSQNKEQMWSWSRKMNNFGSATQDYCHNGYQSPVASSQSPGRVAAGAAPAGTSSSGTPAASSHCSAVAGHLQQHQQGVDQQQYIQILCQPMVKLYSPQLFLLIAQLSQVTYNNNSRVWTNSNASKFCVSQWQSYTYILLSNVKSVRAVIIRPSRSYPSEPSFLGRRRSLCERTTSSLTLAKIVLL